jgi:hypothetical protein
MSRLRGTYIKKAFYILFVFLTALSLPASEIFFCSDGPLRIRDRAGLAGKIIGRLQTFEYALVEEVDPNILNIDGIPGSWVRIRRGDDAGWVYGGYGIILQESYPVNELGDLEKIYPSSWSVEKLPSYLMSRNGQSQIILQYFLDTGKGFSIKHDIYISIKGREADLESLAMEHGLELVRNASAREVSMGMGGEYQVFRERKGDVGVLPHLYDEKILYFQSDWDSSATTDIAAYLSEGRFKGPFKGIMFCYYNLWPDARDPSILDIDNIFIRKARERGERKSLYYQVILEIMKRVELDL